MTDPSSTQTAWWTMPSYHSSTEKASSTWEPTTLSLSSTQTACTILFLIHRESQCNIESWEWSRLGDVHIGNTSSHKVHRSSICTGRWNTSSWSHSKCIQESVTSAWSKCISAHRWSKREGGKGVLYKYQRLGCLGGCPPRKSLIFKMPILPVTKLVSYV